MATVMSKRQPCSLRVSGVRRASAHIALCVGAAPGTGNIAHVHAARELDPSYYERGVVAQFAPEGVARQPTGAFEVLRLVDEAATGEAEDTLRTVAILRARVEEEMHAEPATNHPSNDSAHHHCYL